MRYFFTLFFIVTCLTTPVLAQGAADKTESVKETMVDKALQLLKDKASKEGVVKSIKASDPKAVLALSKQMHEIWPMRQKVEGALDNIAERLPEKDRAKFKGAMRHSIDFPALEAASIDAMADIFSEKELLKMIGFYGSKEGRSVSHKTGDYEEALQPLMIKMMDKAFLNAKMGSPQSGGQSTPK